MKRVMSMCALGVVLVGLSSCTITVEPINPFVGAEVVDASGDGDTPTALASGTVTNATPAYFKVNVPTGVSDPLLFIEADATDGQVSIKVYNSAFDAVAQSSNPAWFSASAGTASTAGVSTQAISRTNICFGPCVAVENTNSTWYVAVSTDSQASVNFDLFAYDQVYGDSTEPANNDCSGIGTAGSGVSTEGIDVVPVEGYTGAIETIGDTDCFTTSSPTTQASLSTDTVDNVGVSIEARVYDAATGDLIDVLHVDPMTSQDSVNFASRSVDVVVSSSNGTAGSSDTSQYDLSF